jgi:tetratricopeptide (TPR) repeat protein
MSRIRFGTDAWIGAGLIALVVAVFGQAVGFELVDWDDFVYLVDNPMIAEGLSARTLSWALTTGHHVNWHPLTWFSWLIDVELARLAARALGSVPGGLDAAVYHATNVALHAANACLLFAVLLRATRRRWESAFVAALFAVHPLHVESVAWVSERKDVLSTLFWMLTMLAYQRMADAPRGRARLAVAGWFALGLLAKPMVITLPLVLLLWDFWPLGRLDRTTLWDRVAEKLPLVALAAACVGAALWAQASGGAPGAIQAFPIEARIANAAISYVAYLEQAIWPTGISFVYLHPRAVLPARAVPAALALAVATLLALHAARSRPYLIVGWLWYLITLLPVIGLIQVGPQARADRYTYIPLIGVFLIVAWGVPDAVGVRSRRGRAALAAAGTAAVLALAAAAWPVVGYWRNSEALFRQALRVDPHNWLAHNKLARVLLQRGDSEAAISHLRAALDVYLNYAEARFSLAVALEGQGKLGSAIAEYERLVADTPDHARGHNNLGSLLARTGRLDAALPHFEAAVRIEPDDADMRRNLERARQARDGG